MRKSAQPRCFIAMAFEPQDVNSLYERQIRPLLRRLAITPVIINRRESNEDLNLQIIAHLRDSDFCITDLTYARPSVYFEAGFAQRASEVIYTVRSDHLRPGQPDNLRVHFDLQMKPLVRWKDPEDSTFQSRLEKRIRATFLRQWNKHHKFNETSEAAIRQFALLPQYQRVAVLRKTTISALSKVGFTSWQAPARPHRPYKKSEIKSGYANNAWSIVRSKESARVSFVHAYPSLRKGVLEDLSQRFSPWRIGEELGTDSLADAPSIPTYNVILSLSPTSADAIESVFSALKPEEPPVHYSGFLAVRDRYSNNPERKAMLSVDWIFLTGIRSLLELKALLIKYLIEPINAEAA